jgi:hypothetical protein
MESEKISKRVLRGVASAAVAGGFHGDFPYGYERVIVGERPTPHGPKPVKEQRPHTEHAPIVEEIFDKLAHQEPINKIVTDLNARGVPAPAADRWERNTIRTMARNVAYLGQRSHKGTVHDGTWGGLVSADVFHAVQTLLGDPKRKKTKPGRMKHLLSYLAATPCGSTLHHQAPDGKRAKYHCIRDGCVGIGAAEAEEHVIRLVVKRVCRPDIRELFTADDEAARRAQAEAAALQAKLDDAKESFFKPVGGISAEIMAETEERLKPLLADALARSVSTTAPMAMLKLIDAARLGAAAVRPAWDELPTPARREVLRLVFDRIVIGKPVHTLSRWSTDADRLTAAEARIHLDWRQPHTPTTPPGPRGGTGGARAQRRRQTSIDLGHRHDAPSPEPATPAAA